jgi:predicted dehydrogenase
MARRPTVALCGAGMVSGVHASAAALLGVPVVAVASRTEERARAVATRVGGRAVAYDRLPADADIVVVGTPPGRHRADAESSFAHGAAAIVEKPLCTTLADADALVELAAAHRERLLYADNIVHSPAIRGLLRLVPRVGGVRDLEVRAINPVPGWRGPSDDSWGGGAVLDIGVHALAIAVLAAAPAVPRGVEAVIEASPDEPDGADEHARLVVHFDTGLRARIVASYRAGDVPQWDAQVAGPEGVVRAELQPSQLLELNGVEVALPNAGGRLASLERFGYLDEWRAFLDDLDHTRRPRMDAAFGRMMLDLVHSAYAAARTGSVEPSPFRGSRTATPLETWRSV